MSADASIEFNWADGTYRFRLALGQLRELQEKVNQPRVTVGAQPIGPYTLLHLARNSDLWLQDVREIIRLGLIGGGMKPLDALSKVVRYVDERPMLENMQPAVLILTAALTGVPDDVVGKKPEAETTSTETTDSSSPQSTDQEQPSDGQPMQSTEPRSGSSPQPSMDGAALMAAVKKSRKPRATIASKK